MGKLWTLILVNTIEISQVEHHDHEENSMPIFFNAERSCSIRSDNNLRDNLM